MTSETGQPGWYPDGTGPDRVRWHDGERWTPRTGQVHHPAPAYASWPARVGASLLDHVAVLTPFLLALAYADAATWVETGDGYGMHVPTPVAGTAVLVGGLLTLAVWVVDRGVAQGRTGQSLGKRAVGIHLRSSTTGTPPGAALCLLRDLGHVADSLACLGYLRPLWDPERRTFADELVSTVVVRDGRAAGLRW